MNFSTPFPPPETSALLLETVETLYGLPLGVQEFARLQHLLQEVGLVLMPVYLLSRPHSRLTASFPRLLALANRFLDSQDSRVQEAYLAFFQRAPAALSLFHMAADLLNRRQVALLPKQSLSISSHASVSSLALSTMQQDESREGVGVLRFFQLLCEDHFEPMQLLLTDERRLGRSLVEITLDFLSAQLQRLKLNLTDVLLESGV